MKKRTTNSRLTEEQKLMQFLSDSCSEEERALLRDEFNQDIFLKDAMEGLEQIGDAQSVRSSVDLLQKQLKRQVRKREKRFGKAMKPGLRLWTIALILLLLLFIAWIVLSFFSK